MYSITEFMIFQCIGLFILVLPICISPLWYKKKDNTVRKSLLYKKYLAINKGYNVYLTIATVFYQKNKLKTSIFEGFISWEW